MKEKLLLLFLLYSLFLTSTSSIPADQTNPSTMPVMGVEPRRVVDPKLLPSASLQINITVIDVVGLYGWEFKLFYLKSVLNLTRAEFGPFLKAGGQTFTVDKSDPDYNATHGVVWLAESLLGAPKGVDGSGIIAYITFTVNKVGSTRLDLVDTKMSDMEGRPIDHEAYSGYFSNVESKAVISVCPDKIINSVLEPSSNFTIDVIISDALDVNSWEFKLFYRHDVLNVSQVEFGSFLGSAGTTSQLIKQITDNYNETHGVVWLSERLLLPVSASGNGTLATVTFHVKGTGETNLTITETKLLDPAGEMLDHKCFGGYFNNMLRAKIFIDPPIVFDPTLTPGSIVTVTVKITDVVDLYGFKFNLTYEKEILNCIGILIIPYRNESNLKSSVSWNDNVGEIRVEVNYYDPAQPITSFTPFEVARIFFQVSGMGTSPLHFHETTMKDAEGNGIPCETEDGLIYIAIRDVTIVDLRADKTNIYPGETVNITLTVKNSGNLTESFTVMILYDNIFITNITVTDLPSQLERTLSYVWNTTGFPPCYNKAIIAYAVPVPYETNLEDNTFIDGIINITLIGDINGDGMVDIFDVTLAAKAFGSEMGEPEYDARVDINRDGIIDIYDLTLIAIHFGEKY